jgi:CheY-like chemotaxis protein
MKPKILLVEDQVIMQQVELALLEKVGYTAQVASNGQEALTKAGHNGFDVIFMDVCLPDMDGTEVTRRLRAMGVSTPIIAMTGNDDDQTRAECREVGMNGFLPKPMRAEQFRQAIEAYT